MATRHERDGGFSIKCPHCQQWSDRDFDPSDVALDNDEELLTIIRGVQDNPEGFIHGKLLRCNQPSWLCPAPYASFVYRADQPEIRSVSIPLAWSVKRDFRLYDLDHKTRRNDYIGMLVCLQPVPRQRHVLMTRLINREILSWLLAGMSREIGSPVTAYVANVYKDSRGQLLTKWIPIEQFSPERRYVPSGYNPLCELCRNAMIQPLVSRFEGTYNTHNCLLGLGRKGTCSGETAFCLSGEWNYCPVFLSKRAEKGTCYSSDTRLIDEVANTWTTDSYEGWSSHTCWLGLREFAFPVVVHDLLVAVLMAGQFVLDPATLVSIDHILSRVPSEPSVEFKERLSRILKVLHGDRPENPEERLAASFRVRESHLDHVKEVLGRSVHRLQENASELYQNFRHQSEGLFKKEILFKVKEHRDEVDFFDEPLRDILFRMRQFWAFRACYLLRWQEDTGSLSVAAYSGEHTSRSFDPDRKVLGRIMAKSVQLHPVCFLLDRESEEPPVDAYALELHELLEQQLNDEELSVPIGRFYLAVIVPVRRLAYMLLFAVRDKEGISTLPARKPGGLSEICQEAIFDTSVEVVRAIAGVI